MSRREGESDSCAFAASTSRAAKCKLWSLTNLTMSPNMTCIAGATAIGQHLTVGMVTGAFLDAAVDLRKHERRSERHQGGARERRR